jgi:pimeloyl-ACP methyl ester carboxylesterase
VDDIQAGGIRLAFRTWGPADAPPVVLLHALGEGPADWAPVAGALAAAWRVYAPDLRGHGARALGGATVVKNLQLLCGDCNRRKGADLSPNGMTVTTGPAAGGDGQGPDRPVSPG